MAPQTLTAYTVGSIQPKNTPLGHPKPSRNQLTVNFPPEFKRENHNSGDRYLRSPHSGATAPLPAPVLERPFLAQIGGTGAWPIERPTSMEPGESQTGYCNQIPFEMQRQLAILHLGSVTVL